MGDVRCPMCGKVNDSGAEACEFCSARLRPYHQEMEGGIGSDLLNEENSQKDQTESSLPGDVSDWLEGLAEEASTPFLEDVHWESETPGGPADQDNQDDEFPDWLNELGRSVVSTAEDQASPMAFQESKEEGIGQDIPDEAPDWMKELLQDENQSDVEERPSLARLAGEAGDDGLDAELEKFSVLETTSIEAEPAQPAPMEKPLQDQEPALADLPTWLSAMRPDVERTKSPQSVLDQENVIAAGPLAGLQGALFAEANLIRPKKPSSLPAKLVISDVQRAQASILKQLIESETQAALSRERLSRPLTNTWGVLIAFILIAVIVSASMLFNDIQSPAPAFTAEIGAVNQLIDSLAPGSIVLLAFEYEPGFSPEMESVAVGVIDHLALKGARFVVVSTSPTGAAQAEHLFSLVRRLQPVDDVNNLGYIPGGAAGLLNLAENPRQSLPLTMDGIPAWESGALSGVEKLADFDMVVVIADRQEVTRAWVEQVQPLLGDTPLIMVLSAQIEAVFRPYYFSKPQQIQGLVAGISGGGAYENLMGRPALARTLWTAYTLAQAVSVAIILIGSLLAFASNYWAREQEEKQRRVE